MTSKGLYRVTDIAARYQRKPVTVYSWRQRYKDAPWPDRWDLDGSALYTQRQWKDWDRFVRDMTTGRATKKGNR